MTLADLRAQFPHLAHQTYLNHAATSPLSTTVRASMDAYLSARHGAEPEASIDNFMDFAPTIQETKTQLAQMLGTDASRVEFVQNTSTALNVLAQGLDWQAGDRIALPRCEFPANVFPFLNLRRQGVEVDFIPAPNGTVSVEDVAATIRPATRLLSVSWVQFLSGFRADLPALGELCEAEDVLFCVDAIQGMGALQMDVETWGVDFLACGGHKWMMGTQGIAFLYCAASLQPHLHPPAGWLHGPFDFEALDDFTLAFHDDARQFRLGTSNNVGIAALHASTAAYLDVGGAAMEAQVRANAQRLADGVNALGLPRYGTADPAHGSGIVTVEPDAPGALFDALQDRGITGALRNSKLRLSPHAYNTADDIDAALDALQEALQEALDTV